MVTIQIPLGNRIIRSPRFVANLYLFVIHFRCWRSISTHRLRKKLLKLRGVLSLSLRRISGSSETSSFASPLRATGPAPAPAAVKPIAGAGCDTSASFATTPTPSLLLTPVPFTRTPPGTCTGHAPNILLTPKAGGTAATARPSSQPDQHSNVRDGRPSTRAPPLALRPQPR